MAWNDGITQEMADFLDGVSRAASGVRKIAEGVIDGEVQSFSERVTARVPVATGGLRNSFKVERDTSRGRNWYGYDASFEGNAPNGEPYEKIANILNYGTPHMAGTQFVSNAVRKLKGMDDRIEARIETELSQRT